MSRSGFMLAALQIAGAPASRAAIGQRVPPGACAYINPSPGPFLQAGSRSNQDFQSCKPHLCLSLLGSGNAMVGRIMAVAMDEEKIGELFPEELIINSHATIAGYLLLGVRGLGLLVLTWSTVVLLGGFVSTLGKKDFWCLTVITLVHATRVFDVTTIDISLNGNMFTQFGFFEGFVLARIRTWGHQGLWGLRGNLLYVITALVLRMVYATLFVVYVFGQHACTVISLARLIQRDYGDDSGNLKPALDLLYSISVLQGLLYLLRKVKINNIQYMHQNSAAEIYKLKDDKGMSPEFIVEYTNKIIKTSDNDPVLFSSDQTNLVTYAVDLLMSEDAEDYVGGARVLDRLIGLQDPGLEYDQYMRGVLLSQRRMIKLLLTSSASSLHLVNKLLHALSPRSQYSTEMRLHAARIVAFVAHEIDLELFPGGIRQISSLLMASPRDYLLETYELDWQIETFDELDTYTDPPCLLAGSGHSSEQQQDSNDTTNYRDLVLQGLRILRRLATNEDNIRIIGNTEGLLDMIMAPLTSDVLHCIGHGAWSTKVVEGSLRVVCTLSSPDLGKTGMKLRGEISSNKEAIKTMYGILKCDECGAELQKQAIDVLKNLSLDTSSSSSTEISENLLKVLLSYFTGDNRDHSLKLVAGRALVMLTLTREASAITVLQEDGGAAVDNLIKILLHAENNSFRMIAAEILEHLCGHCTVEKNYSEKLKKSMTDVMPKLLAEILRWGPTLEEAHSIMIQDGNDRFSSPDNDIEDQSRGLSEATGQQGSTSSQQEMNEKQDDMKLQVELLSLCVKVCDTFSLHLDAVAAGSDASNIPWKLKEVVERNDQPTADSLTILKQTFKMAISMVKHANRYGSEGLESLIESLFKASESMIDLEISMVFYSSDHVTKPDSTLASLAKEARELLEGRKAQEMAAIPGIPL